MFALKLGKKARLTVKLKFGLVCTILVAMGCFLEGGYAFVVGGHAGIIGKNLETSRITNSYVSYDAYNYTQFLDHFGYTPESYQTFPQRYFMDKTNWGGAQCTSHTT
ncbi:hypothetical protein SUGI_0997150 [Cryptomeria japonica]|nr:hypothetical protein SUGI_0997150 [Cryptomeria japonica]